MTDSDPLAAFDDDIVAAVARETGLSASRLREALRRQQEYARSLPTVDGLVYDWRRALPYDPLVRRDETAYYLVFTPSVWTEFGEQLSFDDETLAATRAVHDRQLGHVLTTHGEDRSVVDGGAAMVLTR